MTEVAVPRQIFREILMLTAASGTAPLRHERSHDWQWGLEMAEESALLTERLPVPAPQSQAPVILAAYGSVAIELVAAARR
jgi:hypothetical protein